MATIPGSAVNEKSANPCQLQPATMDSWAAYILSLSGVEIARPEHQDEAKPTFGSLPQQRASIATILVDGSSSRTTSVALSKVRSSISTLREVKNVRWRAVMAIVAGVCQQMLCWGLIMTFGAVLSFYSRHLMPQVSKKELCLVGAIPPFLLLALALLWGRLLDAAHHRKLNIFAAVCLTSGLTGLAFTAGNGSYGEGHYWEILLSAIPIGLGQSVYFLAAPHMAKTWFPEHKGFVMGLTNSGAAIGGVVWPFVFTKLTSIGDFRAGIGGLAIISAVLGCFIIWAAIPATTFQRRPVAQKSSVMTWVPLRAFRSTTFLLHVSAMCCIYLGILTIPFFIEYWAQTSHLGVSEDTRLDPGIDDDRMDKDNLTVYLVVIMNACQLPGRFLGSTLCDYVRARKIHLVASIAAICLVVPFWLAAEAFHTGAIFAGLIGLTLGIMVSLPINDVSEILGAHRTHLLGQYAGIVYTCASPFILAGAIVSGELVDMYHIRSAGLWVASAFTAGAAFIALSLWTKDDTWKFDMESDNTARAGDTEECVDTPEPRASTADGGICRRTLTTASRPSLRQRALSEDEDTEHGHLGFARDTRAQVKREEADVMDVQDQDGGKNIQNDQVLTKHNFDSQTDQSAE